MAVKLLYFFVSTPEECLRRVARRVAEGGHDVPEIDLRRRFDRSLKNFAVYARVSDFWRVHDTNALTLATIAEGAGVRVDHDTGLPLTKNLANFMRA